MRPLPRALGGVLLLVPGLVAGVGQASGPGAGATVAAATVTAPPVAAQRSLTIEELHADIEVQSDGSILVTERLRPRFSGDWNGILRHVSLQHTTARGEREKLGLELLSATDGDGRPLEHEVNRVDEWTRELKVWVPDARDRTATVVLRYRVTGPVRFFAADSAAGTPAYDELYWQVTGTEWEVPIEAASARVVAPPDADVLQAAAYTGVATSRVRSQVWTLIPDDGGASRPRAVEVPAVGPLAPGEGLTVAVGWTPGAVPAPEGARAAPRPLAELEREAARSPLTDAVQTGRIAPFNPLALIPLLLPFLAFWIGYRAWDRRGRDPERRATAVQWEPPAGLTPAEVGTLVDHDPELHDIISTLVDLAVRGYIVIAEREESGLLGSSHDYAFHLVRPRAEWDELKLHERRFLDGLFEGTPRSDALRAAGERLEGESRFLGALVKAFAGDSATEDAPDGALDSVLLSDLKNEFYQKLPGIRDAVLDQLVELGHYDRRPDQVRNRWGGGAALLVVLGLLGMLGFTTDAWSVNLFGLALLIGGLLAALVTGIFAAIMPARTDKGARTMEAAIGFRRFLERVEQPRYRRMIRSPDQFETFLPYAMAFQCEREWAAAFEGLLTEPPSWYYGQHGAFNASSFASDLGGMATAASSTLSSSPSSSGSGGGGSVGGGSGGGGGGGF